MTAPVVDVDAVIRKAESQIGVTEVPFGSNKTPYGAWYPMNGVAWCFIFVSWVLHHAGYGFLKMAWTPAGVEWAKAHDCWRAVSSGYRPKKGDIVFFDFPGDGVNRVSHVGIVTGPPLADGRVPTIEGNTNPRGSRTGGMVMRHNRSTSGIVGYLVVKDKGAQPPAKPPVKRRWLPVSPGIKDPDLAYFGGFDNQVTEIQLRLKAEAKRRKNPAFDPGDIDGDHGPKTQAALRAWKDDFRVFQRAFGLPVWPKDADEAAAATAGTKTIGALRWATGG